MTATLRSAVRLAVAVEPHLPPQRPKRCPVDIFGKDVFSMKVMRERLPAKVFNRLEHAIQKGESLFAEDADVIAGAMKEWAIEHGATHYTHWFQPMTGTTAEKHDAFLTPTPDGNIMNEFSGKMLIKGEPDASSFPSGGIRSTFEARGYTAWDPTSPAFLMENTCGKTLYVPSVFFSYTGESLDRKTPLLRSLEALSTQTLRILRLFGNTKAEKAEAMVGAEQEYFLVDRRYFSIRTDLMLAGRTVFGARPSKGQELEDHYFGAISPRVLAFMADVEERLLALNVPARTRHNEVAPGQFELAPMFEPANLATDHNMLTMEVLRTTAERHGFACLLHEKPFAGINGSGKHNNWSLCDSKGNNLLDPGATPMDNAQFLVFLAVVLRAVHKHSTILRLGTIGAGNDHRLGANEAPPAILSIFLGEQLTAVIDAVINDKQLSSTCNDGETMKVGVSSLPPLPRDISDRNRTSPFAFTGNKFEFRAVGSSQSIAPANIALNVAVACALDDIATELESALNQGVSLHNAVHDLLVRLFKEHSPIVFNGNGYAAEWQAEAARRGLPNFRDTVSVLEHYSDKDVMEAFTRTGVLNERELLARQEILLENYIRAVHVETKLTSSLGHSVILPTVRKALKEEAQLVAATHAVSAENEVMPETDFYRQMRVHVLGLTAGLAALDKCHEQLDAMTGTLERAVAARDNLLPLMAECRKHADALENITDDAKWPLPKYNELLWQH